MGRERDRDGEKWGEEVQRGWEGEKEKLRKRPRGSDLRKRGRGSGKEEGKKEVDRDSGMMGVVEFTRRTGIWGKRGSSGSSAL